MNIFQEILHKYWGYSSFRPLQEEIIESVYAKKDTLGLMPTGGGKSITFQVPALAMEGICIVVTPLIALMKDQVDNLRARNIKALAIYSGMSYQEILTTYDNAVFGDFKFLYISPERLNSKLFIQKVQAMKVCMLVVDEAHCISQWGYDFRPSYLHIASVRKYISDAAPILALTATATPNVVDDIQNQLRFETKNVFTKSFERKNLIYYVKTVEDKISELISILSKTSGCTLIYVRNRNKTKEIAEILQANELSADYFHAGLSSFEKSRKQEDWKNDKTRIIVCTNAFGMGIDKSNVRVVIHIDLPNSIEEYFQEAGRAGRDEKKSYALILNGSKDISRLRKRVIDEFPEQDFIRKVYDCLSYFFQIAEGYGEGEYHKFNIYNFVKAYKLSVLQTHHALKILSLSGYIDYQDDIDHKSRVEMIITRHELYQFEMKENESTILNFLLRRYTGLFSDYVTIDELEISHNTGISRRDIYDILVNLSKRNILNYIPASKDPMIGFLQARQASQYLYFRSEVYSDRLVKFRDRIAFVCDYVNQKLMCRSRFLLSYFGEIHNENCGKCDICREKTNTLNNCKFQELTKLVIERLREKNEILIREIPLLFDQYEQKEILDAIRINIDHQRFFFDGHSIKLIENGG